MIFKVGESFYNLTDYTIGTIIDMSDRNGTSTMTLMTDNGEIHVSVKEFLKGWTRLNQKSNLDDNKSAEKDLIEKLIELSKKASYKNYYN